MTRSFAGFLINTRKRKEGIMPNKIEMFEKPRLDAEGNPCATEFVDMGKLFGFETKSETLIEKYVESGEYTPEADPNIILDNDFVRAMIAAYTRRTPLAFTGDTGTGKTMQLKQFAALLNIEMFLVSCHEDMEVADLLGEKTFNTEVVEDKNGNFQTIHKTDFQDALVTYGAKRGGMIVLDEIDLLQPGRAAVLNGCLRVKSFINSGNNNEVVRVHPDAVFFGTLNTKGFGNKKGFNGTKSQNMATMSRFRWKEIFYPAPQKEAKIIQHHLQLTSSGFELDEDFVKALLKFIHLMRGSTSNGDFPIPVGIRSTIDMVDLIADYSGDEINFEEAVRQTLYNRLETPVHREIVRTAFSSAFSFSMGVDEQELINAECAKYFG
jgi:MoxR-like ATPase